jgi:hypothetical protein
VGAAGVAGVLAAVTAFLDSPADFLLHRDRRLLDVGGAEAAEVVGGLLSEVAECARRELILKAYRVSRRIKVSEKRPKKPTSAAKLAAAKEAGKKGGLAKSAAKTTSNRANAKKPRPSRRGKPVGKRWS